MLAVILMIAALIIAISPFFSALLEKRRVEIVQWTSNLLGVPVNINSIEFAWYHYQPEINLNEVTIFNKDSQEPILQVRHVGVFFSIWQSLWNKRLMPNGIIVSGTSLTANRSASGEIFLQGFSVFGGNEQRPFAKEMKATDMMAWLITQNRIILRNIDIRYSDFTNQKQFVTLYNLSIENNDIKHLVLGKAILHQDLPTEATIALQWKGNDLDINKVRARMYIYVSGASLTQWLKDYTWKNWQIKDGILSAKIWATWNHGIFKRIQINFQGYGVNLYSSNDKSIHKVNRLSGHVGWKRLDDNSQIVAGEDILIDLPTHLWPVTSFFVKLATDNQQNIQPKIVKISYLDIQDIQAFLNASQLALPPNTLQLISQLNLKGGLQDVNLRFSGPWTDWQQVAASGRFKQLGFSPWRQLPGAKNLSGKIMWDGKQGELSFQSNRSEFKMDSVFQKPVIVDQFVGDIQWSKDEKNTWYASIPSLQLLSSDGAINVNGRLNFPVNTSPTVDLAAHFTIQKMRHLLRYLPLKALDPDFEKWLSQAFLNGEIRSGNIKIQGALDNFPFDQGKGVFYASAIINNIDLNFAPNWPPMRNIDGKLVLKKRELSIDIEQASLVNIPLKNVHGIIPYIGDNQPQILKISSDPITVDFSQGIKLIESSPLKKVIGKVFSDIDLQGPITLNLGLNVPLRYPEKTQVKGNIAFPKAQLKLTPWHISIDDMSGNIGFSEEIINAANIQGKLFNKPIQLNLQTINQSKNGSFIQAQFATNLAIADLQTWLNIPFKSVAQGTANVSGKINFSDKIPITILLNSNLVGVTLNLPDQYQKPAEEARNLSTEIIISEDDPLKTKIIYGDLLSAALILEHKNEKFKLLSANFRLGGGDPSWPTGAGLYITGSFASLDWDKIKQYATQTDSNMTDLPLRGVDIQTKKLDFFGQRLTQVRLQITPEQNLWNIIINSPEVAGRISLPTKLNNHSQITADFERLNLHSASTKSKTEFDTKNLPAIALRARDLRYDNMAFGEFVLRANPGGNGMLIDTLRITSAFLDLQARGRWSYANSTRLEGLATTKDISGLLNSLGLDAHNFVSTTGKLNFDLSWHGAPYAISIDNVNGDASIDLGKGRIVDVGQASDAQMGIGRMLSIFSLQTIPRRLMFDFSDLFQKGYSFDNVRGNFELRQGSAYTTNLAFDGPIARVGINGRIGLQKKDYDFTLSVTPYVSSGLPIAAGLLTGGPIGGAAALALSTVLGSAVSKAATYYYSVKGPWNNPSWQSIDVPNNKKT